MYKEVKKMSLGSGKVKLSGDAKKASKALGRLSKIGDDARKGLDIKPVKVR